MPAEGDGAGGGTTATHLPPSDPPASSNEPSDSSSHLSGGAIAGIAVGSVAFVLILCVLLFLLGRNQVYKKWLLQSHEGSGASSAKERTARWALSTAAAVGGKGNSDSDANSSGVPNHTSPVHNNELAVVPAPGYASMDGSLPRTQSGVYYTEGYGYSSPPVGSQMQSASTQQPYWIWDQNIQPYQLVNRNEGPSELEADNRL